MKMSKKGKETGYMEIAPEIDHLRKHHQKEAFIRNKSQLQNHSSTFLHKNKSLLLATSILSHSPMAFNTTASLDKLTCTDCVDFGKVQDRSGQFSWSNNDSNYLDVKFKVFKKDDIKDL